MSTEEKNLWLAVRVRVNEKRADFVGQEGVIKGIHLDEDENGVYEVNLRTGEHWFSEDELEHVTDPRDGEITRLREALKEAHEFMRSEVNRLETQRDTLMIGLEQVQIAARKEQSYWEIGKITAETFKQVGREALNHTD